MENNNDFNEFNPSEVNLKIQENNTSNEITTYFENFFNK